MFDDLSQNNNSQNNNEKGNEKPKDLNYSLNANREQTVAPSAMPVNTEKKERIEDIFKETDKVKSFEEVKKELKPLNSDDIKENKRKDKVIKILILIGFIIGLIVILGGSYLLVGELFNKTNLNSINNVDNVVPASDEKENNTQEVDDNTVIIPDSVESSGENNMTSDDNTTKEEEKDVVEKEVIAIDSDKDGLSDVEELKLGLDINNVDSDNDGLFDKEEVTVYLTDPLDSDTDKDGFLDGAEVRDGYNPNGSGKLYDINNNI